jgi:hypothetical protein
MAWVALAGLVQALALVLAVKMGWLSKTDLRLEKRVGQNQPH